MQISRKTRLVVAGLVIAVAGTAAGVAVTQSSAKAVNPLCTPAALSELMGYWEHKENQAKSYTDMRAIYGAGMTAELRRGKLCDLPGFG